MKIEKYNEHKHEASVVHLARNLKVKEAQELRDVGYTDLLQGLLWHFNNSDSYIAKIDDIPVWGFGVHANEAWLLGTRDALKYKKKFLLTSKKVLEELLPRHDYIYGHVPQDYVETIRWLKYLGATFHEKVQIGNQEYVQFIIRRFGNGRVSNSRTGGSIKPESISTGQGASKSL